MSSMPQNVIYVMTQMENVCAFHYNLMCVFYLLNVYRLHLHWKTDIIHILNETDRLI